MATSATDARNGITPPKPLVTDGPAVQDGKINQSNLKGTEGITADPTKEYVSGGWYGMGRSKRSLPWSIDDLTFDFGDDIYDRMSYDPQIHSTIEILKLAVLSQGVYLMPSTNEETNVDDGGVGNESERALAEEICTFCQSVLEDIETPFVSEFLYDMLDAFRYGNRTAEIVWQIPEKGPLANKVTIRTIKPKPRHSTSFVVDAYLNLIGLLVQIPGQGGPVIMSSFLDPSKAQNILPRWKFCVMSFRKKNADPRGQSAARPAYNAWWLKMQMWPEYLKFLVQFASPSLVGKTAENAERTAKVDANGDIELDANGDPIFIEPEAAMMNALLGFRNGSVIAIPHSADVKGLETNHVGSPFTDAIELLDRQMAKGILLQTLATEEGKYQARAAAQTHQDVLSLVIQHAKATTGAMVREDLLKPLVMFNYGEEYLHLTPTVSLSMTEQHDFAQNAAAVAALQKSGYFHPSQLPRVDSLLNLQPRTPEQAAENTGGDPNATDSQDSQPGKPGSGNDSGSGNSGSGNGKPGSGNNDSGAQDQNSGGSQSQGRKLGAPKGGRQVRR